MARLGRAQPFRPLLRLWNYTQTQLTQASFTGVGTLSLIGSSLGAGVLAAVGTGNASLQATTPPGAMFLRTTMANQTVNRSSVY